MTALSAQRLNAMLNEMGQQVSWRKAHDCPCRKPHSGAADYQCPACEGKGVLWEGAVAGVAAVAGQRVQANWAKLGEYASGDMVLTLPADSPLYAMGQFDRLTMLDSSIPFSTVLVRSGGERIVFDLESISRVFWLVDAAVEEGGIPSVGADGVPVWAEGEPPNGVQYTVTGRRRPEYFVFRDLPQDRAHYGGAPLPRRVVVRRMDLFGRGE